MPGKFAKACQDCGKPGPTRFRTLQDRYLCESCYRKPTPMTGHTAPTQRATPGAVPHSVKEDAEPVDFDLRHLQ